MGLLRDIEYQSVECNCSCNEQLDGNEEARPIT